MLIVTFILFSIIVMLIVERQMIQISLRHLSLRILVNGTRGKSSVTEYVAAGILQSQGRVMAKVTGIVPTIIHNGIRQVISRYGVARVQEQVNMINLARKKGVNNLVLECMSIAPELQRLEGSVFKPHIYVITNIRDDHREEMGVGIEEQAEAICNAIPVNCKVITSEKRFLDKIKEKADANRSTVVPAVELDSEFAEALPHGVFPENVALALTVCKEAGIGRSMAETGIMNWILNSESPLTVISCPGKTIRFLNAFSANDTDSTESILKYWQERTDYKGRITVVFNTRSDRPVRTDLFSEWLGKKSQSIDLIILTGTHTGRAKYHLLKSGVERSKIETWKRVWLNDFKTNLFNTACDGAMVIGVGNIAGDGFTILKRLK